jgi:hypothetical protein
MNRACVRVLEPLCLYDYQKTSSGLLNGYVAHVGTIIQTALAIVKDASEISITKQS